MSDLLKKMRHRRFNLRPSSDVQFLIETSTGSKFKLTIHNVSLNGIAAWTSDPLNSDDGLEIGTIIPAAKITFKDHEYALGRMVVRVKTQKDSNSWFALS